MNRSDPWQLYYTASLQIWDTAGQERFKALRTPFYRGSDICLLAYAVDDRMSFRGLMKWHEEFLKYADVGDSRFPFIVVGNKVGGEGRTEDSRGGNKNFNLILFQSDLGKTDRRQVTAEEVAAWCKEYNIASFIETSAKQAVNITEAFSEAVRQWKVLDRIATSELRAGDTIDLMQRPITIGASGSRSSNCCGSSGRNSPSISSRENNL